MRSHANGLSRLRASRSLAAIYNVSTWNNSPAPTRYAQCFHVEHYSVCCKAIFCILPSIGAADCDQLRQNGRRFLKKSSIADQPRPMFAHAFPGRFCIAKFVVSLPPHLPLRIA